MQCKWQVEIDPYCQRVLAKHWPEVRRHDDIKTFSPTDPQDWGVDVICGGFPCQDISYAGKGAGLAGERSGLFYELARVVREVGPRIVLLENVAALLTRGMDDVLGTLASLGFDAEWGVVSSAEFGAHHIRERVFILAYASGERCREAWSCGERQEERGVSSDQIFSNTSGVRLKGKRASRQQVSKALGGPGIFERDSRFRGMRDAEPGVVRVVHGVPHRMDRVHGLGNAVDPRVAEWIGRRIVEAFGS